MYQITVNPTDRPLAIITQERQLNTDKLYMFTAGITALVDTAVHSMKKVQLKI